MAQEREEKSRGYIPKGCSLVTIPNIWGEGGGERAWWGGGGYFSVTEAALTNSFVEASRRMAITSQSLGTIAIEPG